MPGARIQSSSEQTTCLWGLRVWSISKRSRGWEHPHCQCSVWVWSEQHAHEVQTTAIRFYGTSDHPSSSVSGFLQVYLFSQLPPVHIWPHSRDDGTVELGDEWSCCWFKLPARQDCEFTSPLWYTALDKSMAEQRSHSLGSSSRDCYHSLTFAMETGLTGFQLDWREARPKSVTFMTSPRRIISFLGRLVSCPGCYSYGWSRG